MTMDVFLRCIASLGGIAIFGLLFMMIHGMWRDSMRDRNPPAKPLHNPTTTELLDGLTDLRKEIARIKRKMDKSYCENCIHFVLVDNERGCGCAKYRIPTASSAAGHIASCYLNNQDNLCPEFVKK